MEIHAPRHPILTLKEALVHLCIITIGILIALSFEGVLEWVHHRQLVREARQNLQSEIRDNQKDVELLLTGLDKTITRFQHAIDVVGDVSAPDKLNDAASVFQDGPGPDRLLSAYVIAWPNSASRATADAAGAFGFMEYTEAHKYADAYEAQALYNRAQDGEIRDVMTAVTLGRAMLAKPTPAEAADAKRQLRVAIGAMVAVRVMANTLKGKYAGILNDAR